MTRTHLMRTTKLNPICYKCSEIKTKCKCTKVSKIEIKFNQNDLPCMAKCHLITKQASNKVTKITSRFWKGYFVQLVIVNFDESNIMINSHEFGTINLKKVNDYYLTLIDDLYIYVKIYKIICLFPNFRTDNLMNECFRLKINCFKDNDDVDDDDNDDNNDNDIEQTLKDFCDEIILKHLYFDTKNLKAKSNKYNTNKFYKEWLNKINKNKLFNNSQKYYMDENYDCIMYHTNLKYFDINLKNLKN
jgi:hypothetical protein